MSSHTFRFLGQPDPKNPNTWIINDPTEINHITKVLRLPEGSQIEITDGAGKWIKGELRTANKNAISVHVESQHQDPKPSIKLSIAIGALRHGHIDEIIPPLCELGVSEVHVFLQRNDKTLINEKSLQRWRRLSESAIKQSKQSWLPIIETHSDLNSLLEHKTLPVNNCYYLDPLSKQPLIEATPTAPELLIVIGGEKGLVPEELALLHAHSFEGCSMGPHILRAKTAAIAASAVVSMKIMK